MNENHQDPLSFPHPVLPGVITMAFRESRVREIGLLSHRKERKTFTVRAVMTDRPQPSNCSFEDVVPFPPCTHVILPDGPFPAFKYYSNGKAVLFDVISDRDGTLTHIQTYLSAKRPELALAYARAAINQFVDTLAIQAENPLSIQRLELLSPEDNGILAYQITVPSRVSTTAPRFHSLRPAGPFRNAEAIYREAITNPSPYYRLLLAYRGFEGVQQIRRMLKKSAIDLKIADKLPKSVRLDSLELAQLEFQAEVLLHVLPGGFVKIRHFGFLANRNRQAMVQRCRELLPPSAPLPVVSQYPKPVCPVCGVGPSMRSNRDSWHHYTQKQHRTEHLR